MSVAGWEKAQAFQAATRAMQVTRRGPLPEEVSTQGSASEQVGKAAALFTLIDVFEVPKASVQNLSKIAA
ncbi:MAG TPA: hypothetical protein VIM69_00405 [Opitutaceae bacterium]